MLPIVIPDFKWSLAEETQQLGVRFAFATPNVNKLTLQHPFVKCRDFLGDMVFANYHHKKVSIYGFTAAEDTSLGKWLTMVLEFANSDLKDCFYEQAYPLIQHYYPSLEFYTEGDDRNFAFVEASGFHQQSIMAISLFTFLLKCAAVPHENLDDLSVGLAKYPKELGYYNNTKDYIKKITHNLRLLHENRDGVTGYAGEDKLATSLVHHSSGFVSLITLLKNGSTNNELANSIRNLSIGETNIPDLDIEIVEEDWDELDLDEEEDVLLP